MSLDRLRRELCSLDQTQRLAMLGAVILDEKHACRDLLRLADVLAILAEHLPTKDRQTVGYCLQRHASELVTLLH